MFTGIIETLGQVHGLDGDSSMLHLTIKSDILTPHLKVDQSISHNGICLTVTHILSDALYRVTAVEETIAKTNISHWKQGDLINLERATALNGRMDGHLVQGHVDQTALCKAVQVVGDNRTYEFEYASNRWTTIEKGSIAVNGVSLTVVHSAAGRFSVAVIPFTYENTNFKTIEEGSVVNLEFDVIGKYVAAYLEKLSS